MQPTYGDISMFTGPFLIERNELRKLFDLIISMGYRIIGPKVVNEILRLEYLSNYDELASGIEDVQKPGSYKLRNGEFFRHGPDSPKRYLYPSNLTLFRLTRDWRIELPRHEETKLAFFGIKPCDLSSIMIMDRVQGGLGDEYYLRLRRNLLLVVENCIKPGNTCFCATMGTGPKARSGFDVAYTQLPGKNMVVIESGSEIGTKLISNLDLRPIDDTTYKEYVNLIDEAYKRAKAPFNLDNLPEKLEMRIKSSIFKEIAERCIGCANCNMVCPTCFCFDVIDVPELDGSAKRIRVWDGCLNYSYAEVAGGHFRPDLWARYRHWLLHKFVYWIKQFGTFGCVGCGRCITWCPAGIDIRDVISRLLRR